MWVIRIVSCILKVIYRVEKAVFKRSLWVAVTLSTFFLSLPLIGVWVLFDIAFYLPPILRAIVIWTLTITLVLLAGLVDYLRSS